MDKKFLVTVLLLLFLLAPAFALNYSDINRPMVTPFYHADLNYFKFPADVNAFDTEAGAGSDTNGSSVCWVTMNSVVYSADWNNVQKRCTKRFASSASTNDFNFLVTVQNLEGDGNYDSPQVTYYLDSTAPVTLGTSNYNSVTLTATDDATTTGNGSGVKRIWYKLDSATWTSSATNPLVLSVPSVGAHTVLFYAMDNLDNNEWVANGGYWSKPFTISGVPGTVPAIIAPQCALVFGGLNTMVLGLIAVVVIIVLAIGLGGVLIVTSQKGEAGSLTNNSGALMKLGAIIGGVVILAGAIMIVIFMVSVLCH